MRFLDLFSVISGAAGIVSLFLSIWDRFATWRKFLQPLAWGFGGFAAGRFSVTTLAPSVTGSSTFQWSTATFLFLAVFVAICVGAFLLLRRNDVIWAYMVFSMGLGVIGPVFLKSYSDISREIPAGDLVLLSKEKERVGDFSAAILYLDQAYNATSDGALRAHLNAQKTKLHTKLVEPAPPEATATPR